MLSRTADHLYWMSRYLERAETTARLLEVGARNALMPDVSGGFRNDWEAVLHATGTLDGFRAKYGDTLQRNVETHLFFDSDNPSSVASCLAAARENARVVRTALTTSVWDALNTSYQELQQLKRTERSKLMLTDLTEWTLKSAYSVRGAVSATQLRNDGYRFMGLGNSIERADNTARLIDVKYYTLLPDLSYVGSGLDRSQWITLLRSISAHRAFVWTYSGAPTSSKIVDFLVLNQQFPRSLLSCVAATTEHLDHLSGGAKPTKAQVQARALSDALSKTSVEDIFEQGLHEFLMAFTSQNSAVAMSIQDSYLKGLPE